MDRRRALTAVLGLPAALFAGGCTTVYEGKLDATLFPRAESPRAPNPSARVALIAKEASPDFIYQYRLGARTVKLVIPIDEILAAATLAALADEFGQAAERYPSLDAVSAAARPASRLLLVAPERTKFELHDEYMFIALPYVAGWFPSRQDLRLIVDWRVWDPAGDLLLSKSYDSGTIELSEEPMRYKDTGLTEERFVRLSHKAAYKLMRRAARDLRDWLQVERLRERAL